MRSAGGTRLPSRVSAPTAKAMSVAIGTPQPLMEGRPWFSDGVDQGRDEHAAQRRGQRECGAPKLAQLPAVDLATDLEPDDEEEDRHQPVVDPEMEVALEGEGTDLEAEGRVPQRRVGVLPGRVRPDQRDGGGQQQDDPAGGLDAQEALDGRIGAPRERARGLPAPGGLGRGAKGRARGRKHRSWGVQYHVGGVRLAARPVLEPAGELHRTHQSDARGE